MLAGDDLRVVAEAPARLAATRRRLRRRELHPHEVAAALDGLPGEDLLYLLGSEGETVRQRLRSDLTEYRRFRLSIRGADLVAAGIEPGPAVGAGLAAARSARLDGEIVAAEELLRALRVARRVEAERAAEQRAAESATVEAAGEAR
jgi:hypothetical protein